MKSSRSLCSDLRRVSSFFISYALAPPLLLPIDPRSCPQDIQFKSLGSYVTCILISPYDLHIIHLQDAHHDGFLYQLHCFAIFTNSFINHQIQKVTIIMNQNPSKSSDMNNILFPLISKRKKRTKFSNQRSLSKLSIVLFIINVCIN